jgi:hypothetical protein
MYYSYVEIEYVATSFSPARTDLAVKLLRTFMPQTGGRCQQEREEERAYHIPNVFPDW